MDLKGDLKGDFNGAKTGDFSGKTGERRGDLYWELKLGSNLSNDNLGISKKNV